MLTVDRVERTITGPVVPYGRIARYLGRRYRFAPGSLHAPAGPLRLIRDHDQAQRLGAADRLTETEAGPVAVFHIDRSAAGDRALATAHLLGFSPGVTAYGVVPDPEHRGVLLVLSALVGEVTLTDRPAFEFEPID